MLCKEISAVCSETLTKHANSLCGQSIKFLGAFEKLWKVTISFDISVRPSDWNNSSPTGRIIIKFDIRAFFQNLYRKFKISIKSDKNNGYFTWRPIYIFDHISLRST